jgi:hypothetical protein
MINLPTQNAQSNSKDISSSGPSHRNLGSIGEKAKEMSLPNEAIEKVCQIPSTVPGRCR